MTIYHTDDRDTFNRAVPFKVIDDATCELVGHFYTMEAAISYALDRRSDDDGHYQVFEVKWISGSKTFADRHDKEQVE
jgi:hypothetical protein